MKSNRAKLLLMLFLIAAVALVSAQGGPGMGMQGVMGPSAVREWFKSLNLTNDDLDKLEKTLAARELELVKAQNEIKILQTKVANMLLEPNPDMEWEKTVRMIQIERQVEIRKILGEQRWQSVLLLVREARMSEKAGKFANSFSAKGLSPDEADRYTRLLKVLRRIM
jgi:Spy/CpxP family protein refolding chaperone